MPRRSPTTVGIVLGDGAPLLELAVPPRIFEVDLSRCGGPRFEVLTTAERPGPVRSSAGIELHAPYPLEVLDRAGVVVIPGWRVPDDPRPVAPELLAALRRAHDEGATVLGLCGGAFPLAEAGLLDGRRATTHWVTTAAFAERYPAVEVVHDVLYVDEGRIITSAGSAAGIDACLHFLRREYGAAAAGTAARSLVVAPHRAGGQAQFVEHPVPEVRGASDPIGAAMDHALERLDDVDLDVDALAARAHLSRRTFDRRFRQQTGVSPLQWVLQQRILRAQHLLETTDLDVESVARRCGFAHAIAMRPHFRRLVGVPPQAYRASFGAA